MEKPTDTPVDQVGVARVAERKQVGFDGNEKFCRCVGKLTEHRLTADHYKPVRASDTGGRANYVLKLRALHGGCAL